ncbi:MAG TPA: hypothetical protein VN783_02970 [Thermoanaerobaculia bacterium]|nr:hypothetical protein [Thermoanaerobaculia bacterium]
MTDELYQRLFDELAETRRSVEVKTDELHRHFDVVAEGLESKIQLVAEGLMAQGERIDARLDRFQKDVAGEFSEVRSMIHFSHSDLDRRVRSLDDRVERLEAAAPH